MWAGWGGALRLKQEKRTLFCCLACCRLQNLQSPISPLCGAAARLTERLILPAVAAAALALLEKIPELLDIRMALLQLRRRLPVGLPSFPKHTHTHTTHTHTPAHRRVGSPAVAPSNYLTLDRRCRARLPDEGRGSDASSAPHCPSGQVDVGFETGGFGLGCASPPSPLLRLPPRRHANSLDPVSGFIFPRPQPQLRHFGPCRPVYETPSRRLGAARA